MGTPLAAYLVCGLTLQVAVCQVVTSKHREGDGGYYDGATSHRNDDKQFAWQHRREESRAPTRLGGNEDGRLANWKDLENAQGIDQRFENPTTEVEHETTQLYVSSDARAKGGMERFPAERRERRRVADQPAWYGRFGRTGESRNEDRQEEEGNPSEYAKQSEIQERDENLKQLADAAAVTGFGFRSSGIHERDSKPSANDRYANLPQVHRPVWRGILKREVDGNHKQPIWSGRYGREADEVNKQPVWNGRYGREADEVNKQPVWSGRYGREVDGDHKQPIWSGRYGREADEVNKQPVWNGRYGREADEVNKQPVWSGRYGREANGDHKQPIWSGRYGREADGVNKKPVWNGRYGREADEVNKQPVWSGRYGREADGVNKQPVWNGRYGREADEVNKQPVWSGRYGREADGVNKQPVWHGRYGREADGVHKQPVWNGRYGREADEVNKQPVWKGRYGREADEVNKQPVWSGRYGREADEVNKQPVWSGRYGREADEVNTQPVWHGRYGREADEVNKQPAWSGRYGREVDGNHKQPAWSGRYGREAADAHKQPAWSGRYGREADDAHKQSALSGRYLEEDNERELAEVNNIDREKDSAGKFVEGIADDVAGKPILYQIQKLKKLLQNRNEKRRKTKWSKRARYQDEVDWQQEARSKEIQRNNPTEDAWRKATNEELKRIDSAIHEVVSKQGSEERDLKTYKLLVRKRTIDF